MWEAWMWSADYVCSIFHRGVSLIEASLEWPSPNVYSACVYVMTGHTETHNHNLYCCPTPLCATWGSMYIVYYGVYRWGRKKDEVCRNVWLWSQRLYKIWFAKNILVLLLIHWSRSCQGSQELLCVILISTHCLSVMSTHQLPKKLTITYRKLWGKMSKT